MKEELLKEAVKEAKVGIEKKEGGPFGAIITDQEGNIIVKAHNMVLKTNDPTSHAEIVAIRKACEKLNTKDLQNCIIYSSCEPCPMCLSAIIWANIKTVYFGATRMDANKCGFKDEDIYDYLSHKNQMLESCYIEDKDCINLLDSYKGEMY